MNCGVEGSQRERMYIGKDPYTKEETKRMLCELQGPFTKALVSLLHDDHLEWANSTYC